MEITEEKYPGLYSLQKKEYMIKTIGDTFFWLDKNGKQATSKVGSLDELEGMACEISGVIPDVLG